MYLDDIRDPKGEFDIITRTSQEAIDWMYEFGCPDFISFDHDLGGDDTAMRVVKWMVERDLDNGNSSILVSKTPHNKKTYKVRRLDELG